MRLAVIPSLQRRSLVVCSAPPSPPSNPADSASAAPPSTCTAASAILPIPGPATCRISACQRLRWVSCGNRSSQPFGCHLVCLNFFCGSSAFGALTFVYMDRLKFQLEFCGNIGMTAFHILLPAVHFKFIAIHLFLSLITDWTQFIWMPTVSYSCISYCIDSNDLSYKITLLHLQVTRLPALEFYKIN